MAMGNFWNKASDVINLAAKDVCAPFISAVKVDSNQVEVDAYTAKTNVGSRHLLDYVNTLVLA